jgi:hypothetical protein
MPRARITGITRIASGDLEWRHLTIYSAASLTLGHAQIIKGLEVQPEFRAGSEAAGQPETSWI